jgi:hypothetical protein
MFIGKFADISRLSIILCIYFTQRYRYGKNRIPPNRLFTPFRYSNFVGNSLC